VVTNYTTGRLHSCHPRLMAGQYKGQSPVR